MNLQMSDLDSGVAREDRVGALWRVYRERLLAFVRGRVESSDAAEDILQEAFIKIHKSLHTLRNSERLESWMYQIVRNAVIDHYRSRKVFDELPQDLAAPSPDEEARARQEIGTCIAPMIESLPPAYGEALKLSEIDGLKQKVVAEKLGLSLSGAKSRVQRGRAMVGDMLSDCCRFERDHRGTVTGYEPRDFDCSACG
ncbi:MAG: RNA polymerase sigma factor SigZ [Alphaproteobacteria bacterium]|nr:RNA polymerase sigma factor SigZ [Alphaproteobacteria bacterium]